LPSVSRYNASGPVVAALWYAWLASCPETIARAQEGASGRGVTPSDAGTAEPVAPAADGGETPAPDAGAAEPVAPAAVSGEGGTSGAAAETPPAAVPNPATPGTAAPSVLPPTAASADEETALGSIVITAQRREDTLQRTPIAISAFGQEQIQQQKISTFRDLAGRVPGLLVPLRSTAYTTQTYSLRGIGELDTYPEPSVAVYVDDVYLARSVGSIYDTPDLERVEVLRGPQGTLYGRNSSAGAIRFITKAPTAERTAGLSVRLGNYDDVELRARMTGAVLDDDKLNASVSAIRHERRGYTYSVPLDKWVNDINIWSLRSKLQSNLTDHFTITASGDVMFDRSNQSYYTPINQPNGVASGQKTDPDLTWSTTQPLNQTDVYGGSLTFEYDLDSHLALKLVSAMRGMHGPIYYDNDGVTYIKGDSYAGFNQNYETEELTLNGDYERLHFVGGVYYFNEYFHNHRLSQAASSPDNNVGTINHTNNRLYTQSIAGFGQADYHLTDELSVTVGARYTADFRSFQNLGEYESKRPLVYPLPGNFDPNLFGSLFSPAATRFNADNPTKTFAAFTPKLGAQYQFTADLLAYASFSQGFKSGGFDLRANTLNASVTPYRPQITTAYEIGWKSALFKNRVTLNLAAFYNKIKDLQVRAQSPGALGIPVNSLINTGDAHTYGGEAELAAEPTRGLRIGGSLALLRTAYDTFTATLPPNVTGAKTLLGLDFPLAPRVQANINFNYRLPIPMPGTWRIGADMPFESKRYIDIYDTPQTAVRAQYFVNGTVNYTASDERWSAGVSVSNLLDLRRPQSGGYAPSNAGTEALYYAGFNPPRMIVFFLNIGKI
jgi:iron complex outermembrane receptor protein